MGSNLSLRAVLLLLAGLAILGVPAGTAQAGDTYVWTGATSNDMSVADNWLVGGSVPATAPTNSNNQTKTPTIDDMLVFNTEDTTWVTAPPKLYAYTHNAWGSIEYQNGTYNYAQDRNSYRNMSWGGTDCIVVGDGDATNTATVNLGLRYLNYSNAGGSAGQTKTYIVNSDGALTCSNKNGTDFFWAGTSTTTPSSTTFTVMRLIGGSASIGGTFYEVPLTGDANNYVSFEALGSALTFNAGTAGVSFGSLSDVTDQFGDSFRLGGELSSVNAELQATENTEDGTFTVTAVAPSVVAGDANGDGVVDSADYVMVKTHFDGAPAAGTEGSGGDFNDNGTVDWDDLQTLMEGINEGASIPIPEPATTFIMMAAGLPGLLKRRRNRS